SSASRTIPAISKRRASRRPSSPAFPQAITGRATSPFRWMARRCICPLTPARTWPKTEAAHPTAGLMPGRLPPRWGLPGVQGRAAVRAFDPDGNDERVVATGLRNYSGMTVQPATGALWCVVNERDGLGDNVPFEYATTVRQGAFYGWPWRYIGEHEDPRHAGE